MAGKVRFNLVNLSPPPYALSIQQEPNVTVNQVDPQSARTRTEEQIRHVTDNKGLTIIVNMYQNYYRFRHGVEKVHIKSLSL